ncbi:mediator of RNA polymerase II transcription subunit 15a-like [Magnolia sinica]|uniref:mediator of RNA polymerase II transcription subunit 15a-like n=1 Tax=Magnolia sinica TaxID=86752 RepID=UPI002659F957|nr:mediator of RNA polymerase II transcription subunit 15a-like [Magnolia sinica]
MDGNNWRPAHGESNMDSSDSNMDGIDWRTRLTTDSRQRLVNKIMDTLKMNLPISAPNGLVELRQIAARFEEKIFTSATSQDDYLRKISMKMLTMETKSQTSGVTLSNSATGNQNSLDPARNQGQSLPILAASQSQQRQQLLPQNTQNSIASSAVQNSSSSLQSVLSSMTGLTQMSMSNAVDQNSNLQSMSEISQNSMGNSIGQGLPLNNFTSSQRQMQGRQQHLQQVVPQQQNQQQSQNPQQMIYQQQLQQHNLKQKLQGNIQPLLRQSHFQQQQQQPLMQTNQMQPSQPSLMQQMPSGLQSIQPTLQQQPSMMQSNPQSGLQQNQQTSVQQNQQTLVQQNMPSGIQQYTQSALRQQQQQQSQRSSMHQQTSVLQQQQTQSAQQQILSSQPQQPLMGQQQSAINMLQDQLLGQQNNIPDMQKQQQRMPGPQNNLSNMQQHQQQLLGQHNNISNLRHQQQQLGPQSTVSGLQQPQLGPQSAVSGLQQQQQQQQQLLGSQLGVSNQQQHSVHMLQPAKVAAHQPQNQQTSSTVLPSQLQQSQSQPPQQQLMSQSQPAQLPQQKPLQQQPNLLQRDMQQRTQTSGALPQSQNAIDQQKQLFQPQRVLPEASSTSMDSTAQPGHVGVPDWQEDVYQKIKSMKELYLPELNEMYQKIVMRFQQLDAPIQQPKQSEQIERLKWYKAMLERLIAFLQVPKSNISPAYKERLSHFEKQIVGVLSSRIKKPALQQPGQQQLQPSVGQSLLIPQQPQSQNSQQQHDNLVNQMQPMRAQGPVASMHSTTTTNLQHATQQNMMNALQTGSSLDSTALGSGLNSLTQGAMGSLQQNIRGSLQQNTMGSLQQNTVHVPPQQAKINTLSQGGVNPLQPNIEPNSTVLQQQHLKQQQEQQLMQPQQLKQQYPPRHVLQQLIQQQQKQQILQQQPLMQQLHQQQKQQQSAQLQPHQMPQLHQMNEANESKMRSGAGPDLFSQQQPVGQRLAYQQQLKIGAPFPTSSPQLQSVSPQISQHSSPQIDQQSLLPSLPKAASPLQSATSPFVVHSPSTPLSSSPIPLDPEKPLSGISSNSKAGNLLTSGMSPSLFLQDFTSPDGNQGGKSSTVERPLERLIKVVQSVSPEAFTSSVSDIGSVVSMIDRVAGSAPGNRSRAAVGEDLVAMTKCRLQARDFISQDGGATTKKIRRHISAMPLNTVPSAGSVNDSFKRLNSLDTSELESTATSKIKRHRVEVNHALLEEIRVINQRLIDTVVEICDKDVDSNAAAAEGEGTVVKCSFCAVALCSNLKSQYDSAQMSPISPLRLLVPVNYPNCSPILLDKLPIEPRKELEDLSAKAKSRLNIYLRGISQPISLAEMARTWDVCARKVIAEYAQESGGGSFSSRYGTWENCISA